MPFQFTHPWWLLLLPAASAWVLWMASRSYVQTGPWRRRVALALRLVVACTLVLGLAGMQWKRPLEGLNVYFLLDRSDSIQIGRASCRERV